MATLVSTYNPNTYNQIANFCEAIPKFKTLSCEEHLNHLGKVFVKFNTYEKYGLILLHRHFDLEKNEVLVDTMNSDGKISVALPWAFQGKKLTPVDKDYWDSLNLPKDAQYVLPQTWAFDEEGQLQAYEFHSASAPEGRFAPPIDFAQELYKELKALGLEKVFGIRIFSKKSSWETTPQGVRANIQNFDVVPEDVKKTMVKVSWIFDQNGKARGNSYCEGEECGFYCSHCSHY